MNTQQIYVELPDEGTIVYRPVAATHIKNMIFKIEGIIPETETWPSYPEKSLSVNIISSFMVKQNCLLFVHYHVMK